MLRLHHQSKKTFKNALDAIKITKGNICIVLQFKSLRQVTEADPRAWPCSANVLLAPSKAQLRRDQDLQVRAEFEVFSRVDGVLYMRSVGSSG